MWWLGLATPNKHRILAPKATLTNCTATNMTLSIFFMLYSFWDNSSSDPSGLKPGVQLNWNSFSSIGSALGDKNKRENLLISQWPRSCAILFRYRLAIIMRRKCVWMSKAYQLRHGVHLDLDLFLDNCIYTTDSLSLKWMCPLIWDYCGFSGSATAI